MPYKKIISLPFSLLNSILTINTVSSQKFSFVELAKNLKSLDFTLAIHGSSVDLIENALFESKSSVTFTDLDIIIYSDGNHSNLHAARKIIEEHTPKMRDIIDTKTGLMFGYQCKGDTLHLNKLPYSITLYIGQINHATFDFVGSSKQLILHPFFVTSKYEDYALADYLLKNKLLFTPKDYTVRHLFFRAAVKETKGATTLSSVMDNRIFQSLNIDLKSVNSKRSFTSMLNKQFLNHFSRTDSNSYYAYINNVFNRMSKYSSEAEKQIVKELLQNELVKRQISTPLELRSIQTNSDKCAEDLHALVHAYTKCSTPKGKEDIFKDIYLVIQKQIGPHNQNKDQSLFDYFRMVQTYSKNKLENVPLNTKSQNKHSSLVTILDELFQHHLSNRSTVLKPIEISEAPIQSSYMELNNSLKNSIYEEAHPLLESIKLLIQNEDPTSEEIEDMSTLKVTTLTFLLTHHDKPKKSECHKHHLKQLHLYQLNNDTLNELASEALPQTFLPKISPYIVTRLIRTMTPTHDTTKLLTQLQQTCETPSYKKEDTQLTPIEVNRAVTALFKNQEWIEREPLNILISHLSKFFTSTSTPKPHLVALQFILKNKSLSNFEKTKVLKKCVDTYTKYVEKQKHIQPNNDEKIELLEAIQGHVKQNVLNDTELVIWGWNQLDEVSNQTDFAVFIKETLSDWLRLKPEKWPETLASLHKLEITIDEPSVLFFLKEIAENPKLLLDNNDFIQLVNKKVFIKHPDDNMIDASINAADQILHTLTDFESIDDFISKIDLSKLTDINQKTAITLHLFKTANNPLSKIRLLKTIVESDISGLSIQTTQKLLDTLTKNIELIDPIDSHKVLQQIDTPKLRSLSDSIVQLSVVLFQKEAPIDIYYKTLVTLSNDIPKLASYIPKSKYTDLLNHTQNQENPDSDLEKIIKFLSKKVTPNVLIAIVNFLNEKPNCWKVLEILNTKTVRSIIDIAITSVSESPEISTALDLAVKTTKVLPSTLTPYFETHYATTPNEDNHFQIYPSLNEEYKHYLSSKRKADLPLQLKLSNKFFKKMANRISDLKKQNNSVEISIFFNEIIDHIKLIKDHTFHNDAMLTINKFIGIVECAIENDRADFLNDINQMGWDINIKIPIGSIPLIVTPLFLALEYKKTDCVDFLINHPDINIEVKGRLSSLVKLVLTGQHNKLKNRLRSYIQPTNSLTVIERTMEVLRSFNNTSAELISKERKGPQIKDGFDRLIKAGLIDINIRVQIPGAEISLYLNALILESSNATFWDKNYSLSSILKSHTIQTDLSTENEYLMALSAYICTTSLGSPHPGLVQNLESLIEQNKKPLTSTMLKTILSAEKFKTHKATNINFEHMVTTSILTLDHFYREELMNSVGLHKLYKTCLEMNPTYITPLKCLMALGYTIQDESDDNDSTFEFMAQKASIAIFKALIVSKTMPLFTRIYSDARLPSKALNPAEYIYFKDRDNNRRAKPGIKDYHEKLNFLTELKFTYLLASHDL